MNNPLPDLANPVKSVEALKRHKSILETAIAASQKEWDAQKKRIAKQTQETIGSSKKSIEIAIQSTQKKLDILKNEVAIRTKQFDKQYSEQNKIITDLNYIVKELNSTKTWLENHIAKLQFSNDSLITEIEAKQNIVSTLVKGEHDKSLQVSNLITQEKELLDNKSVIKSAIKTKNDELLVLEDSFVQRKAEIEKELDSLIQKKNGIANKIIDNSEQDEKVRQEIAVRLREIEYRDKNVRAREAKVAEKEDAVVRNYNLMNL